MWRNLLKILKEFSLNPKSSGQNSIIAPEGKESGLDYLGKMWRYRRFYQIHLSIRQLFPTNHRISPQKNLVEGNKNYYQRSPAQKVINIIIFHNIFPRNATCINTFGSNSRSRKHAKLFQNSIRATDNKKCTRLPNEPESKNVFTCAASSGLRFSLSSIIFSLVLLALKILRERKHFKNLQNII